MRAKHRCRYLNGDGLQLPGFLVKCSLVKEVNLDRSAMRYCPNMHEHCHFYCDHCGGVFDIDFAADDRARKSNCRAVFR